MPLPPFSRSSKSAQPADVSGDAEQAVRTARTRARQRLVGVLVLLAVGVAAFPLLFETQPRPLAMDTPIRAAQRDSGTVQAPGSSQLASALPADAGLEEAPASAPNGLLESAVSVAAVAEPAPVMQAPPAAVATVQVIAPAPAPAPAPKTVPEPKQPTSASAARFVVQVGAFSDARTLREARAKVEKLGLKTYTQVIDTTAGKRTRVRVGPFANRDEAEAAAKIIKGGGLPAAVLTL